MKALATVLVHEESVERPRRLLARDLRAAAAALTEGEVRYLVDLYYQLQNFRIASGNAVRSGEGEPNSLLMWYAGQIDWLERQVPAAMREYAKSRREGRWALSIHGIGPVLAAGLLAHFDIGRAPTVGHFWSFAGLNPDMKWEKGQKRPFSLRAKVLTWKCGQSFMKLRGGEKDIYGKMYEARKALEIQRNEAGVHKGYRLRTMAGVKEVDLLPPFIVDARARRWAVKLFLAHLHHVMHEVRYGTPPPKPYILARGDHAHFVGPPNWPCE
jgi:hypothetical protein